MPSQQPHVACTSHIRLGRQRAGSSTGLTRSMPCSIPWGLEADNHRNPASQVVNQPAWDRTPGAHDTVVQDARNLLVTIAASGLQEGTEGGTEAGLEHCKLLHDIRKQMLQRLHVQMHATSITQTGALCCPADRFAQRPLRRLRGEVELQIRHVLQQLQIQPLRRLRRVAFPEANRLFCDGAAGRR